MAREALKALSRRTRTLGEAFLRHDPKYPHKDRSTVLMQCSDLESALQDAILSKCVLLSNDDIDRLFEGDNPLSTFSAQIKLGYALGIFGKQTRADLNCIRDIRNAFAHAQVPISFSTPEVIDACAQLRARYDGKAFPDSPEMQYFGASSQIAIDLLAFANEQRAIIPDPVLP